MVEYGSMYCAWVSSRVLLVLLENSSVPSTYNTTLSKDEFHRFTALQTTVKGFSLAK
eukprot:m.18709 g.18709  ORF g.18709 m.18709 type:complete len:57 (-) comp7929_c0_seq1:696-866(-)